MRNRFVFFLLLFTVHFLNAQFTFDYAAIKEKYSRFNTVILDKTEEITIDIIKDSVIASQRNKELVLILNENSKQFSNDRIPASSFTKIRDIDAKTFIPDKKGKYKSLKVTEFKQVDDISDYVFYDDSKAILLTFPALQEGAVTSLEYTIDYLNTRFLRTFIFKSYIPVLKTSLIIKVNKNIELDFKEFHSRDLKYKFIKTEDTKYNYFRWEAENLEAYKIGGDKISILHYSPHIIYYIGNVNINGLKKKQYGTLEDLYKYYFSMIRNVDTTCNEALRIKTDEIINGIENEEAKVEAILNWVRKNIKYIAFEQGMRGFIPEDGKNVYTKKYGDCKDMSTLIVTMLNCAGIKSHLTWTGTRHIPYSYEELPLPKTDNHMIAVYLKDSIPVILDGTIADLTYGYPPYLLQGKEILLSFNENEFKVFKVPVLSSEKNQKQSVYQISVSNGKVTGKGELAFQGYNRSQILYALSGENANQQKIIISNIFTVGNNKFLLENYKDISAAKQDKEIKYQIDFSIPDYIKSIDDELYINMNIDKSYSDFKMDTSISEVPLENDFCFKEKYITSLEIPNGYGIESIPVNRTYKNNEFGFEITYKSIEGKIVQEKNIYFNFLELDVDHFPEWNSFIAELVEAYREMLVFKKNV